MTVTHVDGDNDNGKDGNPDGNIQIRSPILYDEASCSEVIRQDDGILEEVVPSRRKATAHRSDQSTDLGFGRRTQELDR